KPEKTQITHLTWTDANDHRTENTATPEALRGKQKLQVPIKIKSRNPRNTLNHIKLTLITTRKS
ncbi:hypothetical protein, partial [Escherichia coli]|uniref:hypothetical protein n=1 Tax=Escherichia coli TaxID=562 RepID=UPI003F79C84B